MSANIGLAVAGAWCVVAGLCDLIFGSSASPYILTLGGVAVIIHAVNAALTRR